MFGRVHSSNRRPTTWAKRSRDWEVCEDDFLSGLDGDRPHAQTRGRGSVPWLHGALASCQANARTYRATDFTISGSMVSAVSVGW